MSISRSDTKSRNIFSAEKNPYQQGTWRYQVEKCTSPDCPLHEAKPTTLTSSKGGN